MARPLCQFSLSLETYMPRAPMKRRELLVVVEAFSGGLLDGCSLFFPIFESKLCVECVGHAIVCFGLAHRHLVYRALIELGGAECILVLDVAPAN